MLKPFRWSALLVLGVCVSVTSAGERRIEKPKNRTTPIRQVSFGPELRAPQVELASPRVAARPTTPLLLAPIVADYAEPTPVPPAPTGPTPTAPAPQPSILPVPEGGEAFQPITPIPYEGESVSILYPHVRYKDLKNVAKCAVPMIVAVPHPCKPCCCTYVKICVPPNCRPRIVCKHHGREIEYQFGSYEVEIKTKRDGTIEVDYDD